jgi:hypothetical protein
MKYIIFEMDGIDSPVIFPPWVHHKTIAHNLSGKVISAGFIRMGEGSGRLYVWGQSKSLGVKSRPVADLDIILRALDFQPLT